MRNYNNETSRLKVVLAVFLAFLLNPSLADANNGAWVGPKCFKLGLIKLHEETVVGLEFPNDRCNIRSGPGMKHKIVGRVAPGDLWPVLSSPRGTRGWVKINYTSTEYQAGVSTSVEEAGDTFGHSEDDWSVPWWLWVIGIVLLLGIGKRDTKTTTSSHYTGPDAMLCTSCGHLRKPNSRMRCDLCDGELGHGGAAVKKLFGR